jgi:hypothetical protein
MLRDIQGRISWGIHALPKVSLWTTMPDHYAQGVANSELTTPLDTPCHTGLVIYIMSRTLGNQNDGKRKKDKNCTKSLYDF